MGTGRAATRGYTLIEMMATVAVAGVVMTAAVPSVAGWIEQQRLKGVAGELAADLQHARTEALLRNEPVRISFIGNACYVVHAAEVPGCRCEADGTARCDDGATPIKAVALPAEAGLALQSNVRSVLFAPGHGTASPTATLRVSGAQGQTVQHTVNVMGRVRSCVAQGAVAGYGRC